MKRQQFSIVIDAPREIVWDILWNDKSYREWTSVFSEGSRAETDWKKGSKILFLSGSGEGMVSRVEENIPNEFLSIMHLGVLKDGKEQMDTEEAKDWAGATEDYTLKTVNGKTELLVDMDITDEYLDHFEKTWPQALIKVKELAEKSKVSAASA